MCFLVVSTLQWTSSVVNLKLYCNLAQQKYPLCVVWMDGCLQPVGFQEAETVWHTDQPYCQKGHIRNSKAVQIKVQVDDFSGCVGWPGVCLILKIPTVMNIASLAFHPDTCFEEVRGKGCLSWHLWAVSHQMFPCAKTAPASARQ